MTDDIVTRLRRHAHDWLPDVHTPCEYCDALYEIERLRSAGDALVAAIRNHVLEEKDVRAWEEVRRG